jgi:tetratricopeptide (TPR) repeat protein
LAGSTVHDVQSALHVDRLVVGDVGQDQGRLIGTLTIIDAASGDAQASIPFLEADDEVIPLLSQLARAVGLELLGDLPAEAVARLVEPISRDERAYRLYTEGAALLRSREDTDHVAAFRRFEEATTLDPGFAHAHLGIGSVCAEWYFRCVHGDQALIKRAESAFEHALRLRPDLPASMGGLISTSWLAGQHSERCLELGRQAAALGNDHVEGQASYAMGLLLGGLAEDAVIAFERVQALDPANQSAAWFLPIATAWSGAHDRTPGLAEAFFERFGDDDEIYLWKAISHDARGEAGKAKEAFDQALRIQQSPNLYIEFYAGHFYARQGNPSLAEAVWRRGFRRASARVAEFPDHPRLRSLRLTLAASLDEERPFEEDLRYMRASPSVGDQVYASIGLAIAGRREETLSALEAVVRSGWFIGYFHFFEHLLGLSWLQADPRYREVIRRDHAQRAKLRDRYVVT